MTALHPCFKRIVTYVRSCLNTRLIGIFCLCILVLDLGVRSWLRWHSLHNETFDFAFYIRIAWGFTEGDMWNPLVGGSVWGLRLSPILYPLGWVGRLFGLAHTLLFTQALTLGLAGWGMMRITARRLGESKAWMGALIWLLYPHLGHVATYEFHPGTLALLPLVFLIDAYDQKSGRGILIAALGVLACREDFAVILIMFGVMMWFQNQLRYVALGLVGIASLWLGIFTLVLHPQFAPPQGSMSLHFGHWGETTVEAVQFIVTHPLALFEHLTTSQRAIYLFKICAPLAFLPLLSVRWLIPASPIIAMNLLSRFPSVTGLDSHYLTPVLPFMIVASLEGIKCLNELSKSINLKFNFLNSSSSGVLKFVLKDSFVPFSLFFLVLCSAHLMAGGTPIARDYPFWAFQEDAQTLELRQVLKLIPPQSSVQAPDRFTPHLAQRSAIYRSKSKPENAEFIIVDIQELQHQKVKEYAHAFYQHLATHGSFEVWKLKGVSEDQ